MAARFLGEAREGSAARLGGLGAGSPGEGGLCCHRVVLLPPCGDRRESSELPRGSAEREEAQRSLQTHIFSISSFSSSAPGRSRLLPRTKTYREGGQKPGPGGCGCCPAAGCCPPQPTRRRGGVVLTGIPCSWGLSSRLWSSFLEASIFPWSAASTMYLGKVGGRGGMLIPQVRVSAAGRLWQGLPGPQCPVLQSPLPRSLAWVAERGLQD